MSYCFTINLVLYHLYFEIIISNSLPNKAACCLDEIKSRKIRLKWYKLFASARRIYTAIGALLGAFFPLVAVLLRIWQYGLSQLATIIKNDPLLWIIFLPRFFLAQLLGWRDFIKTKPKERSTKPKKPEALVADEVRKLAERTQKATKEIAATVHTIQHQTTEAITTMNRGQEDVRAGESAVQNTHDALERITHQARHVSDMVAGIATASEQQAFAMNDIGQGVYKIVEVAQRSSTVINETSASGKSLHVIAEHLQETIATFRV